jgi:hypothetical protein
MDSQPVIKEFTEVTLTHAVEVEGVCMPRGAGGVVMGAYADGRAYEVEFDARYHVVLTLEGPDIQVAVNMRGEDSFRPDSIAAR